ncbi:MAG: DNA-protecting protein DprA [Candidatus Kerfeldbacteria bacterium]|nr:DNA-protecting protein DprA [Candidatus Kerfeldbacteria bacterium]
MVKTSVIAKHDPRYPPLLRELPQPPEQLFVRGNPSILHRRLVAIVGTRRCTDEGVHFTQLLVETLNRFPEIVTVSGLAFGIDAAVHQTAIRGRRPTVAVLASGVDSVSPTSHERLAADLLKVGGCILSEYPAGTPAHKGRFPARNRIIAGLAGATVVIEAGEPSGALITAYAALDQNRDVLAVPGSPFNPVARGTNALLKRGAIPVTEPADLLDALGLELQLASPSATADPVADGILAALEAPRTVDQLAETCTIPLARLSSVLSVLELDGRIRVLADGRVVRADTLTHGKTLSHR